MDDYALEEIRNAKKLTSSKQPLSNFLIPKAYIYQGKEENIEEKEINKNMSTLFQMRHLQNADYTSISVTNRFSLEKDLEEIAIEAADEKNCILLCKKENERLYRLGSLLNLKIGKFSKQEKKAKKNVEGEYNQEESD